MHEGVQLAVTDFRGSGPAVLLLHGLAGYAGEWAETAHGLADCARVVAFDARGHGASERHPEDVSRAAHIADARFVIDAMNLAPAVVVGQSLGGQTALLMAAAHPELVRGLVLVEASPDPGDGDAYVHVERWLRRWPVPFATRAAAVDYFASRGLRAEVWADGLEERGDGWWPRFDIDLMVRTLREADSRAYWDEWETISCPILVVRGRNGTLPSTHAELMAHRAANARIVELDAGHDVHLERPDEWLMALRAFLGCSA